MMRGAGPSKARTDLARSIAKAERILRDELSRGCDDRLVQGGLEAFVRHWMSEMQRLRPSAEWQARARDVFVTLRGYARLNSASRQAAIHRALAVIEGRRSPAAGAAQRRSASRATASDHWTEQGAAAAENTTRLARAFERHPLDASLEQIKGIGPARAKALARLGLRQYEDLLWHFPNRHESYPPPRPASELLFMQKASFQGQVKDVQTQVLNRGLRKISARLADSTGQVTASWLRAGFSGPKLTPGQHIAISGNMVAFGRQAIFENPDWEPADSEPTHTRRMVPIYPLTSGIHPYWLRSRIHQAVAAEAPGLADFLPQSVKDSVGLAGLGWAIAQMHFPDSPETLELARRRLAFQELFLIQLVVLQRRLNWQANARRPLSVPTEGLQALIEAQAFSLTNAQERVIKEISTDLSRPVPMSRLLQGEVGSGKTAVAAVALFVAVANGGQGVLMAPTEILAEQHFRTLADFYRRAAERLTTTGYQVPRTALLTGSLGRRQKESIYKALSQGELDILVGTHAVIQQGVEPRDLVLSVVDEQHRFGVRQRIGLRDKGQNPHLLVMTATPIPRTLALSLHGDLDLSTIDELPPGRQKIKTYLLRPSERPLAYEHVRREANKGRQAFLICPLIEDSPTLEARAATEEYERLRKGELAGLRLALLHGRMRPADKDSVMRRFRDGEFDVLVSTSVVEVGVDVPNATIMLIEGAERFGLAQLHQFRGRVGRSEHQASCILLSDLEQGESVERLKMLVSSDDGLELAEYDLRQRGPGDFFGVRQSGLPELRVASFNDIGLVEQAREAAAGVLAVDPDLNRSEHSLLSQRLAEFVHRVGEPN
jgi:ATP-dependent DNA helicase RecG